MLDISNFLILRIVYLNYEALIHDCGDAECLFPGGM